MQSLECFLNQTYENRRLVILDDYDEPSFPDAVIHPLVHYQRSDYRQGKMNIPMKRNLVNSLTECEAIAHWDSDDYYAPTRLADQMERLDKSKKAVTGYHTCLFYKEATNEAFQYRNAPVYAVGTSLCYLKSFWEANRFMPKYAIGSDNQFVKAAQEQKQLISVEGGSQIVARIHINNTSSKDSRDAGPRAIGFYKKQLSDLPEAFLSLCGVGV